MKKILILLSILVLLFAVGCSNTEVVTPDQGTLPSENVEPEAPVAEEETTPEVQPEPEEEMVEEEVEPVEEVVEEVVDDTIVHISLRNFKAYPDEIDITPGTTVVWHNEEENFLHLISWNKMPVKGGKTNPGESWKYTFSEEDVRDELIWYSATRPSIQGKYILDNEKKNFLIFFK